MTQSAAAPDGSSGLCKTSRRIDEEWMPGPRRPYLAERTVHVWRADLTTIADDVLDYLSPDERERSARFPRDLDGRLWARSRGALRALIGRYLDVRPATIAFALEGRGKPSLARPGRGARLSFNLSHSGHLALYAFTRVSAIGVDGQTAPARQIDEAAIAARLLGSSEGRRLAALEPGERAREFLYAWVRHEAILKCNGAGLRSSSETRAAAGGTDYVLRQKASQSTTEPEQWVADLDLGEGAVGAVVAERRPEQVRFFSCTL
jgi:4'-phosphopantetheinyl transferase